MTSAVPGRNYSLAQLNPWPCQQPCDIESSTMPDRAAPELLRPAEEGLPELASLAQRGKIFPGSMPGVIAGAMPTFMAAESAQCSTKQGWHLSCSGLPRRSCRTRPAKASRGNRQRSIEPPRGHPERRLGRCAAAAACGLACAPSCPRWPLCIRKVSAHCCKDVQDAVSTAASQRPTPIIDARTAGCLSAEGAFLSMLAPVRQGAHHSQPIVCQLLSALMMCN